MKFGLKISGHDVEIKIKQAEKFLHKGNKVKIIIMLKGRENSHPERAYEFADKLIRIFGSQVIVENAPKLNGNNLVLLLKAKK